jgi:membrane-anchored glycerophosphoryl diester phosphodiesterase (GDPDase)
MIVSIATTGAMTTMIADICLHNTPSVRRSYGKLLRGGLWLRLLLTTVWQIIVVLLGFLLLVVPGIILSVRLFFTPSVVVLERLSGNAALKRSLNLSKGHFWRLWGDMIVLSIVFILAPLFLLTLLSGALGFALAAYGAPRNSLLAVTLPLGLAQLLTYPLLFIGIVLLYYDLRVRKEAYDVAALSEDMMR